MCCTISQVYEKVWKAAFFFVEEYLLHQMVYIHSASCKHLLLSLQVTLRIYLVKVYSIIEDPQIASKTCLASTPSLCSTNVHPDKSININ